MPYGVDTYNFDSGYQPFKPDPIKEAWNNLSQQTFRPLLGQLMNTSANPLVRKISDIFFPEQRFDEWASGMPLMPSAGIMKPVEEAKQLLSRVGVGGDPPISVPLKIRSLFEDTYGKELNFPFIHLGDPSLQGNILRTFKAMENTPEKIIDLPTWESLNLWKPHPSGSELVAGFYDPDRKSVNITKGGFSQLGSTPEKTIFHELGHAIQEALPFNEPDRYSMLNYFKDAGEWPVPPNDIFGDIFPIWKAFRDYGNPGWPYPPLNPAKFSSYANTHPVEDLSETLAFDLLSGTPYSEFVHMGTPSGPKVGSQAMDAFKSDIRSSEIQKLLDTLGIEPWYKRW